VRVIVGLGLESPVVSIRLSNTAESIFRHQVHVETKMTKSWTASKLPCQVGQVYVYRLRRLDRFSRSAR
jgi:hypothetical protein